MGRSRRAHGIDQIRLLDMDALLDAVDADLARARRMVLVEAYILRDDHLGRWLTDRLADAVARGARVRILFDAIGSREGDLDYFQTLEQRGVLSRPYRRIALRLGRASPVLRDHSRVMVIDDAAYSGGHAWADPWLPRVDGGGGYHDLSCRMTGPVVEDFVRLFDQRWREADGSPPALYDSGRRFGDVRLVSEGGRAAQRIRRLLIQTFDRARERIWVENAYYAPESGLARALSRAAARGVQVRVVIPANGDIAIIARAARAQYDRWLRDGIEIWEYLPALPHGKAALVDDDVSVIGSFNANPLSLRFAIDVIVWLRHRGFTAALAEQIERDVLKSRRVTADGIRERRLMDRAIDSLARTTLKAVELIGT
jgi:cardiolipin synthase A/B